MSNLGWKGPKIPRDFTSLAISTNFIFKVIGGRSNIKAVAAEKKININHGNHDYYPEFFHPLDFE